MILLLAIASALAAPPTLDEPVASSRLTGSDWLRALSLDLRGVIPSVDDYDRLVDGEVPDLLLDEWLQSEAFADEAVRYHRGLLWPNISDIRLLSNRQRMITSGGIYYRYLVAPNYRGGPISCGDFEAEWDDEGRLITRETEEGWIQEGWVWVSPYWAPDTEVKVCAFEAQDDPISPWGTVCNGYDSRYDPNCGCGPNLAWCDTPELGHVQEGGYQAPVHRSLARDLELRVKRVVAQDLPYTELLTGRTAFVNGPLVHYYTYNLATPAHIRLSELPIEPERLPDLAFTDEDTWVEVELGPEQSGVLTSPAYLMKFQTRRARASRFYDAFLCQPFTPPDGGIADVAEPNPTLDLTQRSGCNYCHALLEPAGAHWGRWSEYGAGYLDPTEFPTFDDACAWCAESGESCSTACNRYYVTDPLSSEEDPFLGMLSSYTFLEDRHASHIETGPSLLVGSTFADGRLPRCSARNAAQWLLGREVIAEEEPWVDELAAAFTSSGYRFSALVRAIVTSDAYRSPR
ncbi:MAG: hypothetical protein ACI8PZ_000372 [Myxococcota bacterium]